MSSAARRKNLFSLWLIIGLVTTPVVASYLLYYFWAPARTVNHGELIEPRPLPDPALSLVDGAPFRLSQLRGKWVLAAVDSGRCGERCQRNLVYMRQLRLTQGKERDRIERVWLVDDDAPPPDEALAVHQGAWIVRAGSSGLAQAFPAGGRAADHIYVIDPLGNLMMRFPAEPDPRLMIKDLTRLLKASRIG